MFGRKKKTSALSASQQPIERMPAEDHALLTDLAYEIKGCFDCGNGDLLLDDAEEVSIATMPVPVIEIAYPDCVVELAMSVYRYTEEDLA